MNIKKEKKFICIRCPRGCEIITTLDGYSISKIEGNVCKMGIDYVENEVRDPRRIVTTTVKVKKGRFPLVPVWTEKAIPKEKISDLMKELRKIEIEAPIEIDRIILKDIFNTGVNVVTSGKVNKT